MALGTLNIPNNGNLEVDIKNLQNPEFTEAETRENIESKESHTTILGKIKKYFTDLKSHAFNTPANNLTTTTSGSYALDAYQGKILDDKKVNVAWKTLLYAEDAKNGTDISTLDDGTELMVVITFYDTSQDTTRSFSKRFILGYDVLKDSEFVSYFTLGGYHSTSIYSFCGICIQNSKIWCDSCTINGVEHINDNTVNMYIHYR